MKIVTKKPLIFRASTNTKDIKIGRNISHEWCNYNHLYKSINPLRETLRFPVNVSRRNTVAYLRFRMCHTRITHRRLLDSSGPAQCMFCFNDELTISHLINDCQETVVICQNLQIDNLYIMLSNVSEKNIKNFTKFLRFTNLFYEI